MDMVWKEFRRFKIYWNGYHLEYIEVPENNKFLDLSTNWKLKPFQLSLQTINGQHLGNNSENRKEIRKQ